MSNYKFNGIGTNLSNLSTLSDAKTRSISPENFDGAKGKGGMATEAHRRGLCKRPRSGMEVISLGKNRASHDIHNG